MPSKYPGRENWYKNRYEWAKKNGRCPTHIKRPAVEGHVHCQECMDRLKTYLKTYYTIESNQTKRDAYIKDYNASVAWSAQCIVAARWELDEPICQWQTLPLTNPLCQAAEQKLKMGLDPCDGVGDQLEIDHMNGGGKKDYRKFGGHIKERILDGDRELDDLRLLCVLHNQWNRVL